MTEDNRGLHRRIFSKTVYALRAWVLVNGVVVVHKESIVFGSGADIIIGIATQVKVGPNSEP